MKPAEFAFLLEKFKQEIKTLKGDDLLDKWIAFEGSEESKEPDLGVHKSLNLEATLVQEFGRGEWHNAVEIRRKK